MVVCGRCVIITLNCGTVFCHIVVVCGRRVIITLNCGIVLRRIVVVGVVALYCSCGSVLHCVTVSDRCVTRC